MKFTNTSIVAGKEILANDHFVAIPYDCTALTALATNNVIKAGTVIPANDTTAIGVLLYDVNLNENPNGAIVIHGYVVNSKLDTAPTTSAAKALADNGVYLVTDNGVPVVRACKVLYDANGGTGAVTDSSSPYAYGSTVTVKASTGITAPSGKSFSGWALTADATAKNDDYDPTDTFTATADITLYAVYA